MKLSFWKKHKNNQSLNQLQTIISQHEKNNQPKQVIKLKKKALAQTQNSENLESLKRILNNYDKDIDCDEVFNLFKTTPIDDDNVGSLKKLHQRFSDAFYAIAVAKIHLSKEQSCPDVAKYISAFFFHRMCVEWYSFLRDFDEIYNIEQWETYVKLSDIESELLYHCKTNNLNLTLTHDQVNYIQRWENRVDELTGCCYPCFGI